MKGSSVSNNDRNSMITMFIIVYVICMLCAILPLVGIFGLPKMADAVYSKAGKKSDGGREKVLVASFDSLAFTLDSLLNVPDLGSRYGSAALRMRTLAEDLQKTNNLYNPVFLKVADLYDKIAGFCEKSKKVDDLTKENINLSTQLESKKLEYDKLKLDKDKLEIQLEKAK